MSKGLGQKIAIQFTEKLTSDISEPIGSEIGTVDVARNRGIAANNGTYANAFDGNTTSYWYSSGATVWVVVDLITPTSIALAKLFSNGDGYWSKGCVVEGSADGVTWAPVFQSTYALVRDVIFNLAMPASIKYRYYKFTFTTQYGALVVTSLEVYPNVPYGNEKAFTITGEEYQYVNGPIIQKSYQVVSVERHPDYTDDKHLLLTLHPQSRFNNAEGNLTVQYDQTKGNIQGRGGPVESFLRAFTPIDLEPKPNPHVSENLTVLAKVDAEFLKVTYNKAYSNETITLDTTATVNFIYVGTVNP